MSPIDQFRLSDALAVIRSHGTSARLQAGFRPTYREADALVTMIEFIERIEAATPASTNADGPEQSGVGVAASYREI
jgi:hypothetical protein